VTAMAGVPSSVAASGLGALAVGAVGDYVPHPMHAGERIWAETNCYIDLWVELLHSLGCDPVPAAACAFSADFDGDQWRFLKFEPGDLRRLYGIDVAEMNVWRPVLEHVLEQFGRGRLLTVEVDSYWLPDTAATAYRRSHVKTTIVPAFAEVETRTLRYFHNAGFFELSGDDFDGVFRCGPSAPASAAGELDDHLPPYVELVRLDGGVRPDDAALREVAVSLAHEHLSRRPLDNPVARLGEAVRRELPALAGHDLEWFHAYAFGVFRQCGATAELAASFVEWLERHAGTHFGSASDDLRHVAAAMKSLQFQVSRAARGRAVDIDETLDGAVRAWHSAMRTLVAWHDR